MAPSTTSTTSDSAPVTDAMSTTPSSHKRDIFPFLGLPAELRNRIYEDALYRDCASGRLAAVALLRVCQQINSEAKEIIYEESAFSVDVTTPETVWWIPEKVGKPAREMSSTLFGHLRLETTFTLGISGDLELCLHGARRSGHRSGTPSIGLIHDSLPQSLLKFRRIDIALEPICHATTQKFLYALACFLSTGVARTEELHIKVTRGDCNDKHMWYPLVKMPATLGIFVTGTLGTDEYRTGLSFVELHVHHVLLE